MIRASLRASAAVLAVAFVYPALAQSAAAQTAPAGAVAVDQSSPQGFIQSLANRTFSVLKSGTTDAQRKERFRTLVREHFAIRQIGDRLIRRYRQQITPQQYEAYTAALPGFIVGAYADRLAAYQGSKFETLRSVPKGAGADVFSRVTRAGQSRPTQATWTVVKDTAGRWRIGNLTVEGVNLLLSQEADFASTIDRQGFDALVAFMRQRSAA